MPSLSESNNKCCLLSPEFLLKGAPKWLPSRSTGATLGKSKGPLEKALSSEAYEGFPIVYNITEENTPPQGTNRFSRGGKKNHEEENVFSQNNKCAEWQCCWMPSARRGGNNLHPHHQSTTSSLTTEEEDDDEEKEDGSTFFRECNESEFYSPDSNGIVGNAQSTHTLFPRSTRQHMIEHSSIGTAAKPRQISTSQHQRDTELLDLALFDSRKNSTVMCAAWSCTSSRPSTPARHRQSGIISHEKWSGTTKEALTSSATDGSPWDEQVNPPFPSPTTSTKLEHPMSRHQKYETFQPTDSLIISSRTTVPSKTKRNSSAGRVEDPTCLSMSQEPTSTNLHSDASFSNNKDITISRITSDIFKEARRLSSCREFFFGSELEEESIVKNDRFYDTSTSSDDTRISAFPSTAAQTNRIDLLLDKKGSPALATAARASSVTNMSLPPPALRTDSTRNAVASAALLRRVNEQKQHVRRQLLLQYQQNCPRAAATAAAAMQQQRKNIANVKSIDGSAEAQQQPRYFRPNQEQELVVIVDEVDRLDDSGASSFYSSSRHRSISFADEVPGNHTFETVYTLPWEDRETRRAHRSGSPARRRRTSQQHIQRFEL